MLMCNQTNWSNPDYIRKCLDNMCWQSDVSNPPSPSLLFLAKLTRSTVQGLR